MADQDMQGAAAQQGAGQIGQDQAMEDGGPLSADALQGAPIAPGLTQLHRLMEDIAKLEPTQAEAFKLRVEQMVAAEGAVVATLYRDLALDVRRLLNPAVDGQSLLRSFAAGDLAGNSRPLSKYLEELVADPDMVKSRPAQADAERLQLITREVTVAGVRKPIGTALVSAADASRLRGEITTNVELLTYRGASKELAYGAVLTIAQYNALRTQMSRSIRVLCPDAGSAAGARGDEFVSTAVMCFLLEALRVMEVSNVETGVKDAKAAWAKFPKIGHKTILAGLKDGKPKGTIAAGAVKPFRDSLATLPAEVLEGMEKDGAVCVVQKLFPEIKEAFVRHAVSKGLSDLVYRREDVLVPSTRVRCTPFLDALETVLGTAEGLAIIQEVVAQEQPGSGDAPKKDGKPGSGGAGRKRSRSDGDDKPAADKPADEPSGKRPNSGGGAPKDQRSKQQHGKPGGKPSGHTKSKSGLKDASKDACKFGKHCYSLMQGKTCNFFHPKAEVESVKKFMSTPAGKAKLLASKQKSQMKEAMHVASILQSNPLFAGYVAAMTPTMPTPAAAAPAPAGQPVGAGNIPFANLVAALAGASVSGQQ